jgi:NAD(P)-dependent dehydrogenase (short-subunit alcohol dehydrogenase family)
VPYESLSAGSVVVTGGARGIGAAIATALARLGSHVVVLDPAVETMSAATISAVRGSAAVDADCARAAATAAERAPLVGWVNNAVAYDDPDLSAGSDRFAAAVLANLAPVLAGSRAAIATFRAASTAGSIVNFSSHQAQRPVAGAAAYATAKGAIEAFTRATSVDHGPVGIRANAVAPGTIMTERHRRLLDGLDAASARRVAATLQEVHPLRRIGEVGEVAATVAFLLADESSFITGAVLPVDGGRAVLGIDPESR